MRDFEKLEIWQLSCRLAIRVYQVFAECQDKGFYSQITRAAVSIASNIAEGSERRTDKDFINFLHIAKGSAAELRTQLYIAEGIGYITADIRREFVTMTRTIGSKIYGLIQTINNRNVGPAKNPDIPPESSTNGNYSQGFQP